MKFFSIIVLLLALTITCYSQQVISSSVIPSQDAEMTIQYSQGFATFDTVQFTNGGTGLALINTQTTNFQFVFNGQSDTILVSLDNVICCPLGVETGVNTILTPQSLIPAGLIGYVVHTQIAYWEPSLQEVWSTPALSLTIG